MEQLEELFDLVDEEIELLRGKLSLIEQMGECVQRGELSRLRELVEADARFEERGDEAGRRRRQVRRRVGDALGLRPEEVTLGRLAEKLGGPTAITLNDRREKLLLLVARLREEAAVTMWLVQHALDFNDRLVAAMAGAEAEGNTYGADGQMAHSQQGSIFQHRV